MSRGIKILKQTEFQNLKQGSMTVSEYLTRFTQLSRYAPSDVDTDEKKQFHFLNGLNDGLAYALESCDFVNFQSMVDKALVLENRRNIMERKRKMNQNGAGSSKQARVVTPSTRPMFRTGQQGTQQRVQTRVQGQNFVTL